MSSHVVVRILADHVHTLDGHELADVLKLVAAELFARDLPGHQLVYDVAFEVHAVISAGRVSDAVARYYAHRSIPPPPRTS